MARNQGLAGGVLSTLSRFELRLYRNELRFFPEYTDHGSRHIETVLTTCSSIIRDDAFEHTTPEDVAALVLSVLLHDVAMHLRLEEFRVLVGVDTSPTWTESPVCELDKELWSTLWVEFLAEARRFDGRTLNRLFGSSDPISKPSL
ncbi:MAG: hypothetical protein KC466_12480, partial [Myxococcales bacterium]|nr:hypothetical protein [Myxococcales bacterium]